MSESYLIPKIIADPDNDELRQKLGYWYLGHGDGERGEFIIKHVKLTTTKCHSGTYACNRLIPDVYPYTYCDFCVLKQGAINLATKKHPSGIGSNMRYWAGTPLRGIADARYWYQRGMIARVCLRKSEWIEHGREIVKQHPIQQVLFSDVAWSMIKVVLPGGYESKHNMPFIRSDQLPEQIWSELNAGYSVRATGKRFVSSESAQFSLSQAALTWAKEKP